MKILILIVSFFCIRSFEKIYRSRSVDCSVISTITKEYELRLKDDGLFIFTYRNSDTRYSKEVFKRFSGQWSLKSDTLILKSNRDTELPLGDVFFLKRSDSLLLLKNNLLINY